MSHQASCPLCGSSDVILNERIRTKDLVELYAKSLKIDVAPEFEHCPEINFYHCVECDLRSFLPAIGGSADFYKQLQQYDWYYLQDKYEYEYAKRYITQTDRVLDIGCGEGAFSHKIPTQDYVGLEMNQAAVEKGVQRGIRVINESIQQHSQENVGKYDTVCAFQVLEHICDLRAFIYSAALCVRPEGLLVFSVPSYDSFARNVVNFILDLPPHHVTRWSDKALSNIAEVFPLSVVEIWHEPLQPHHRRFYARTIASRAIRNIFRHPFSNVDLSLKSKMIEGAATFLGSSLRRGLIGFESLPTGISVTAVFSKHH